jgi:hypothetical protein
MKAFNTKQNNMTISNITKQIEKLELEVLELGRKLHKTQCTQVEMELYKTKEILFHFEKIQALLNN